MKLGNLSSLEYISEKLKELCIRIKSNEYFIPISGAINVEDCKLTEVNLHQRILKSVEKISNEKFVNGAPEKFLP